MRTRDEASTPHRRRDARGRARGAAASARPRAHDGRPARGPPQPRPRGARALRDRRRLALRQPDAVRRRRGLRALPARRGRATWSCSSEAGVDVVFAPPPDEMYPAASRTTVHVGGPLTETFEADERPGHFDGVATVVTKLLPSSRPTSPSSARRTPSSSRVIRRLARDLDLPVEIVGVADRARARRPGHELAQRLPHARSSAPSRPTCTAPCWPARARPASRAARPRTPSSPRHGARPCPTPALTTTSDRAGSSSASARRAAPLPHRLPRRRRRRHVRAGARARRRARCSSPPPASARRACSTTSPLGAAAVRRHPHSDHHASQTKPGAYPAQDATD